MDYFKKCPKCGRYMVSKIVSTRHVKWICICGYSEDTCGCRYDNTTTYTGGVTSDRAGSNRSFKDY